MLAMKKKEKAKKRINTRILIMLALTVAVITIMGLVYDFKRTTGRAPHPIYEEVFSIPTDLAQTIAGIDRAIYKVLYQGEISEGNILFSSVKPRRERGNEWDFTELMIKLPKDEALLQLDALLKAEIAPLKPKVQYESKKISEKAIDGLISALGFRTHQIKLRRGSDQKTPLQRLPKVAIIIDDLGYDLDIAKALIKLDLPLSLSLLPVAPHREGILKAAQKKRSELMLHLPMEPNAYPRLNPGPGTLFTHMDAEEIQGILGDHLGRIPGVRGVNNHMGSSFTSREDKMGIVLRELKRRQLFYVDSRTTSGSVAFDLAERLGVHAGKRSVFLDNDLAPKAIAFQMERLLGIARHSGEAIGIGHPHWETLKILDTYRHELKNDFEMVPVSKLVK